MRDAAVLLAGRGVLLPFAFVSLPLMTGILTPAEIGRMVILMAVQGWFSLVLISPMGNYVNRMVVEWTSAGTLPLNLWRFALYTVAAAAVASVAATAFDRVVGFGIGASVAWLVALVSGHLVLHTLYANLSTGLNILSRRGWYVALTVGAAWVGLGGSALLAIALGGIAEAWLAGQLIVEAALAVVALWAVRRITRSRATAEPARAAAGSATRGLGRALRFAWPLAIGVTLYWLQTQAYPFFLVGPFGTQTVGVLAIGLGVGVRILSAFDRLFGDFYLPLYYTSVASLPEDRRAEAWDAYGERLFTSLVIVGAFAVVAGPILLRVLTPAMYHGVAWLASWGAVVEVLRIVAAGCALAFHGGLRTRPLLLPSATSAAIVVGGVLLVLASGADPLLGTSLVLVAAGLAGAALTYALAVRSFGVVLRPRRLALAAAAMVPVVALFGSGIAPATLAGDLVALVLAGVYTAAALAAASGVRPALRRPGTA